MEEFDQIIKKIREINSVKPSPDFTPTIMHKISLINERRYAWIWRKTFLLIKGMFDTSPTKEECVMSFISMGVFYLIFGLMLLFFIKSAPANSEINIWLKLQSPIFIMVALWFTILGSAVWFMERKATRFARWGLIIYILIFVVNTAVMSPGGNVALLLGTGLSIGAVLTGVLLNISVEKYGCESNTGRG